VSADSTEIIIICLVLKKHITSENGCAADFFFIFYENLFFSIHLFYSVNISKIHVYGNILDTIYQVFQSDNIIFESIITFIMQKREGWIFYLTSPFVFH